MLCYWYSALNEVSSTSPRLDPSATNQGDGPGENSIAVLAFEDLSQEGDHEFFADGLSEELLNVLAKVDHLQVAGRTSSFAFKGQNRDLREIGEILHVAHILEGSVRKAGNRIRVTAQLIEASTGYHLFSETYDRDLDDVFAVQDEIASEISAALLTEITDTESIDLATQTDPEAYELYLLARQRIYTRELIDMREAQAMLARALEIDPDYPPALTQKSAGGLPADGRARGLRRHAVRGSTAGSTRTCRSCNRTRRNSRGSLRSARFDTGSGAPGGRGRRDAAKSALSLNPNLSDAGNWLANLLGSQGRRQEAIQMYESVFERDPMYGPAFGNLSVGYMIRGNHDRFDSAVDRVEEFVGENDEVLQSRGIAQYLRGELANSYRNLDIVLRDNPNATIVKMWHGFGLLDIGDFERAIEVGNDEHRMLALLQLGYVDEARQAIDDIDVVGSFPPRVLANIGHFYIRHGEPQELIDYIDQTFGSLDGLLSEFPVSSGISTGYLPMLTYAHMQLGNEEIAGRLIDEMVAAIEIQRDAGQDVWLHHASKSNLAALQGDADEAVQWLTVAIDRGMRSMIWLSSPVFDAVRDDPGFQVAAQRMQALVDTERGKVGLPPYRRIEPTEDQPESFVN